MRRNLDAYYTPDWATRELLNITYGLGLNEDDAILEPCSGDGAIAKVLRETVKNVWKNDIDEGMWATYHRDATDPLFWQECATNMDWIISNPPFSLAHSIVSQAVAAKPRWGVAMLLRLSFLEPTYERGDWLEQNPPSTIIVLPRISFTGDGKTDSVTTAWFIWYTRDSYAQSIHIVSKGTRENPTLKK